MQYTVNAYEKEIGIGLIEVARKYGWPIVDVDTTGGGRSCVGQTYDYYYIHIFNNDGLGSLQLGMVDFLEKLRQGPKKPPICNLGKYTVEHAKNGIKVGCINVTKDEIKKIYNAVFPPTPEGTR